MTSSTPRSSSTATGLSIETRPHYGIRITGPELSRRICLANVIVDRFNDAMGDIESETNRSLDTLFSRLFKDRQEPDPDCERGRWRRRR